MDGLDHGVVVSCSFCYRFLVNEENQMKANFGHAAIAHSKLLSILNSRNASYVGSIRWIGTLQIHLRGHQNKTLFE